MSRERLAQAQSASSLRQRSFTSGNADWVAASGLAQVGMSHMKSLVQRAGTDQRWLTELLPLFRRHVSITARRENWKTRGEKDRCSLAHAALAYWLDPQCPDCRGVGFEAINQVRGDVCQTCSGTGQRAVPDSDEIGLHRPVDYERLTKYIRTLANQLDSWQAQHIRNTKQRLG